MNQPTETLAATAQRHGLTLPDDQLAQLDCYCRLLWDWNSRINLTRHTDYEKFVTRDLVDSLAFAEFLKRRDRVLDVGTGGGVPGIVLAVVRPDLRITLTETVGKKVRVVQDIVEKLELKVRVYHGRAEELLRAERFDTPVIRAVARLGKLLDWFAPLFNRFERLLILKGPTWVDERNECRHHGQMRNVALRVLKRYRIAGTDAESVLLLLCPKSRVEKEIAGEEPPDEPPPGETAE